MYRHLMVASLSLALHLATIAPALPQAEVVKLEDEALAAMAKSDWRVAVEKYKKANELLPNKVIIETNLGFALMQLGEYNEAIPHLLHATEIDGDYENAWMNLSASYQATNQFQKQIDTLEHFIKITKKPAEKEHAEGVLKLTKAALQREVPESSKDDYLQAILAHGGRERWPAERQPVKVYIDDGNKVQGYKPEYLQMTKQSFADWQNASGNRVRFEFVTNKADAAIDVRWVSSPSELQKPGEAGECTRTLDGKGIKAARVAIGLFDSQLTPEKVHNTILHEIGHACGMDGHSMKAGDIMYISAGSSVTVALSARDKETIRRFYSEDLGESWRALNNQGNELTQKQDFKAAADCYAKAMKLTDQPMVRSNYVALHFNWANAAAKKGDMKTADEHFKAAWNLQREKPDGNYSMMLEGYAKFLRFQKRNAEAIAIEKLRKKELGSPFFERHNEVRLHPTHARTALLFPRPKPSSEHQLPAML